MGKQVYISTTRTGYGSDSHGWEKQYMGPAASRIADYSAIYGKPEATEKVDEQGKPQIVFTFPTILTAVVGGCTLAELRAAWNPKF